MRPDRWPWSSRRFLWIDAVWVLFAAANLLAMFMIPMWETVPLHLIFVSLVLVYGFRLWQVGITLWVLAGIMALTGAALVVDVRRGSQPVAELAEVPLLAIMFLTMLWHARRRLAMLAEMRRISDANLRLLERERRFIQNASHELRTPITVAIGHAELVQRARDPQRMASDARVVVEELMRLRRLSDRLLLLAAAEDPDFLHIKPIEVEPVLVEALQRWSPSPRQWRLGPTDEAVVDADADRLALAIDALVENAVKHTTPADWIELSVQRHDQVEIRVADSGEGIAEQDLDRIFERFARSAASRQQGIEGIGLGLSIVKAIAEAHHGSLRVHSALGKGSQFEILLPISSRMLASSGAPPAPGEGRVGALRTR